MSIVIRQCPLIKHMTEQFNNADIKPIYLAAKECDGICCELAEDIDAVLLIPSNWTLEQGTEWLKKDAQEFKRHNTA